MVIPDGIVTTAWPRVKKLCADMDVEFDSWEDGAGQIMLGKRADGKFAATVGGIVLSIPRQVGKTFLVGMIIIALCILFPGSTILWTAHRARTSTKTFDSMKGWTRARKIAPYMLEPRNSNGEQEIRFTNGSVIMFGARESGFGRGFDKVDAIVFDESQILGQRTLDDMVPSANQSKWAAGALLFFMGTPPKPSDPGEAFLWRRAKALAQKPADVVKGVGGNAVYVEFSADEGAALDDDEQRRKANPSYPKRTPLEAMERMLEQLGEESYRREALGIYPTSATLGILPGAKWSKTAEPAEFELETPVVCVDFMSGLQQSYAIVVAGAYERDGIPMPAVEVARYEDGFGQNWSEDFIAEDAAGVCAGLGLDTVVVDQYGEGNGVLIPALEKAGLTVKKLNTVDMRNASVAFKDAVFNERLLHLQGDASSVLDDAVAGAAIRSNGTWAQEKASVDLVPLRAASAALWVLHSAADDDYDVRDSVY